MLMERKNEPAQVLMQIWPSASHISIKMVLGSKQALLTFMALKSFFIFYPLPGLQSEMEYERDRDRGRETQRETKGETGRLRGRETETER